MFSHITTQNSCLSKTVVWYFHPPACYVTVCGQHETTLGADVIQQDTDNLGTSVHPSWWLKMEILLLLPSPLSLPHITVEFLAMQVQVDAR